MDGSPRSEIAPPRPAGFRMDSVCWHAMHDRKRFHRLAHMANLPIEDGNWRIDQISGYDKFGTGHPTWLTNQRQPHDALGGRRRRRDFPDQEQG